MKKLIALLSIFLTVNSYAAVTVIDELQIKNNPTRVVAAASRVSADTTNFDKNLSASDDTVQKALETLDDMSGGSSHNLLSSTHSDTTSGSPVLGDLIYADATPKWVRLAGNATNVKKFLYQTGNGTISAPPDWAQLSPADISIPNIYAASWLSLGTTNTATADTGAAYDLLLNGLLYASADNDTLRALYINTEFDEGAYGGVTKYAFAIKSYFTIDPIGNTNTTGKITAGNNYLATIGDDANYAAGYFSHGTDSVSICDTNGPLTINNAYTFPSSIGSAGQVLKVPSSGTVLTWGSGGGDHNDLTNIQGGNTGEYYHFTSDEHTNLVDINEFIDGNDYQLKDYDNDVSIEVDSRGLYDDGGNDSGTHHLSVDYANSMLMYWAGTGEQKCLSWSSGRIVLGGLTDDTLNSLQAGGATFHGQTGANGFDVELGQSDKAGGFTDYASNSVDICDGTYAINATGTVKATTLITSTSSDPGSPADGQIWYNSTEKELRVRVDGKTYKVTMSPV